MNQAVPWCFEKLCKEESLEDKEHIGWPSEVDNNQLRGSIEADPLTRTWEDAKELNIDHSIVIWHLNQIGEVKKLDKWVSHELNADFKNCNFEVLSSFILHNNIKLFLSWIVTCDEKWIL